MEQINKQIYILLILVVQENNNCIIFNISGMMNLQNQGHKSNSNQQANIIMEETKKFIQSQNGCMIQSQPNTVTFEYFAFIDEFETKRVICILQERKNSYKFSFISKISIDAITGGLETVLKEITNFNNDILQQNNCYSFNQPNLFTLRSIIEKDSICDFDEYELQKYLLAVLKNNNNYFIINLSKLIYMSYEESYSSTLIKQKIEYLNIAKIYYDQELKKRSNFDIKREKKYRINYYALNPQIQEQPEKILTEDDCSKFNACQRKIRQQTNKTSSSKPLVHKIKVLKQIVDKSWKAPESSNGILERVKVQFITLISFNQLTAQHLAKALKQQKSSDQHIRSMLVRKNKKVIEGCLQCCKNNQNYKCQCKIKQQIYKTELNILSHIRNISTDAVASYFIENQANEFKQESVLYSQFYPKCLSTEKFKAKQLFPVLLNLLEGLKKLNKSHIVHRDLKPSNILIDSRNMPKIIDFGSAWITDKNFCLQEKICEELFTTKKYNLYYEEANFDKYKKMTVEEFERHDFYDMHAFGVILRQLSSDPQISSDLGHFLQVNLNWLSQKCCIANPNLRLSPEEAFNIFYLLHKIWYILKCQNLPK